MCNSNLFIYLFIFKTKRALCCVSAGEGLGNLICQWLSSCNRLCQGCNLLLLFQATSVVQWPHGLWICCRGSFTCQCVCMHKTVSEVLSRPRATHWNVHLKKHPGSSSPLQPPTTKILQDCQKHFPQSWGEGMEKKGPATVTCILARAHTLARLSGKLDLKADNFWPYFLDYFEQMHTSRSKEIKVT